MVTGVSDEATNKIIAALTALLTPRPAPGEKPTWARDNPWVSALSFQSGVLHRDGTPSKPVSELSREEKIELYLAGLGRRPTIRVYP
jgi:hypothetical protein